MGGVETLVKQTKDAYEWVNRLVDSVPMDQWEITPEIVDTNVSWQVGHLILSFNFHSIMVICGPNSELGQQIPFRTYAENFAMHSKPADIAQQIQPQDLRQHLQTMQRISLETIANLNEEDLQQPLEPTAFEHPVAQDKFEALDWNIKHTMWHSGQLGLLKKVLGERYAFKLKKKE